MTLLRRLAGLSAAAVLIAATGACSSGLGNVLGSVLGGGGQQQQSGQVSGTIRSVNNQQITIQQQNGQSVALSYDNETQVVYQNQRYAVNNLEYGDRVTATVRQAQNGYYTDYVQVDQSVSTTGTGTSSGSVQSIQGNVRQVDSRNGLFTVESNSGVLTVALPYNPRSADVDRFQRLRQGEYVRFYGVYLNNSRVELRQFY